MIFRVKRGPLETVKDVNLIHGELFVDTTEWIIRMGDSETPGGQELSTKIKVKSLEEANNYILENKTLMIDSDTWVLRIGDGVTPGGIHLTGALDPNTGEPVNGMSAECCAIGIEGQIAHITETGAAGMTPGWAIYEGTFVATADELTTALNSGVTQEQVFAEWGRFSHSGNTQPANTSELDAWSYDAETGNISCTANTSTYVGFYSNEKFDNFELSVQFTSDSADNDRMAIVIALHIDSDGKEHTLSAIRNNDNDAFTWRIVYNYLLPDAWVVADKSDVIIRGNNWNTYPNGTKISVVRDGDVITAKSTQNDATEYDESSTLNINLTSDSRLAKFRGPQFYGYAAHSQNDATLSNITMIINGPLRASGYIFDISTGDVYVPDGNGGFTLIPSLSIDSEIGYGKIIRDKSSGRIWYTSNTEGVVPINTIDFTEPAPEPPPPVYSRMITEHRVLITGDTLPLSMEAMGGLVMNTAFVFDTLSTEVATEYTCHINTSNYTEVVFDSADALNGKYATVSYMSTGEHLPTSQLTTVTRELISDNKVTLPSEAIGDIVLGVAKIFDTIDSEIFDEYTCAISASGLECLFDSADALDGKYATFSYYSAG